MNMQFANVGKSVGLVGLLLTSLMIGLVTVPTASAVNETASGTIVTTETWSGTHTLTGDVTVAEGAKLVIQLEQQSTSLLGVSSMLRVPSAQVLRHVVQHREVLPLRFALSGQHHPITALLDDATNRVTNS